MDTKTPGVTASLVPHSVLAAASHDLRGPLGVVRGYLRLLARPGQHDEARARKAIEEAGHAADRLASLLDELSAYARLASGEARLQLEDCSLPSILADAVRDASLPSSAPIELAAGPMDGITIRADRHRLTAACATLAGQLARAQMPDTAVLIRVTTGGLTPVVHITATPEVETAERRAPQFDRAAAGISLAMADLTIRLHGGMVQELWVSGGWVGYEVGLG